MTLDHRRGERGQVIVMFALFLVVIIAFAGLLIDVGFGWSNRRIAQSGADTAALSAARAASESTDAATAAQNIAAANGYPNTYVDCQGVTQTNGVVVNHPPLSGPHTAALDSESDSYVEVIVTKPQHNFFSGIVGQGCWLVSARAVAKIAVHAAASCSFCSLNTTTQNHTLLLQNGATLRVDGDIYVNSLNGGAGPSCTTSKWKVCGDGFDIFGTPATPPAYISAQTISVAGGWETHDQNVVIADTAEYPDYTTNPPTYKACPAGQFPNPPLQGQTSNVCIHRPQITDPLNDSAFPNNQVADPSSSDYSPPAVGTCPSGTIFPSTSPSNTTPLAISANQTICPGKYYGGIKITGGTTTMLPGVYYMGGGGFTVSGAASLDGSSGVMIYNSSGMGGVVNISPDPDLAEPIDATRSVPTKISIKTDHNPIAVGSKVTYTFHLEKVSGGSKLNGTVDFYDGSTKISSCATSVITNVDKADVKCAITYASGDVGTHGIAAVFVSTDPAGCHTTSCYANAEAVLDPQQVVGTSTPPGVISIVTTGNVKLSGIKSGPYRGIVMFSDRTTNKPVTISPGTGLAACSPNTSIPVNGVTGPQWALTQPAPDPCGALGGIEGTLYAANQDALVTITASGVADLQIIAGKILVTSSATARFAYVASKFAGGSIQLVE